MPRGNFWEVTYDPNWEGPDGTAILDAMPYSMGAHKAVVTSGSTPAPIKWTRKEPTRRFELCDLSVNVQEAEISNCVFTLCRFKKSRWDQVKFSNCHFEQCDFSGASFRRCIFIKDCTFTNITASAEFFRIEETAISARAFIGALQPNLKHLPEGSDKGYQVHRFVLTRQKIARALYVATRNEPDVEYYHEAYEQLTRATLAAHVEDGRYALDSKQSVNRWTYYRRSLPARIESAVTLSSGWLTAWGRSVSRAVAFFMGTVAVFAFIYGGLNGAWSAGSLAVWTDALLRALNVTLVAGYTADYSAGASTFEKLLGLTNVVLGLYWYSLVIPVIARRILR